MTEGAPQAAHRTPGSEAEYVRAIMGLTFDKVPDGSPDWLEALILEAKAARGEGRKALWLTPWLSPSGEAGPEHEQFGQYLCGVMAEHYTWLLALLQQSGAYVFAGPGAFRFALPANLGTVYELKEMLPYTLLLPWEHGGVKH